MKPELQDVLERIGWSRLYEQWIPNLTAPDHRGERHARSPFPDSSDTNPSFGVNINTGLWRDWHADRAGNYVQFVAYMEAEEYDDQGKPIVSYSRAERKLTIEHGVANALDPAWVEECRRLLYHDLALQANIQQHKPWTREVMWQLSIGYDVETDRYVIPLYDQWQTLVNARLYRPGAEAKMIWKVKGMSANLLFPNLAWREQQIILVEGESDAISLRSLGFHAASGTMGAGQPVPEGPWAINKSVYVWMDDDQKGHEATAYALSELSSQASQLYKMALPTWENRPAKPDPSDFIKYLLAIGYDTQQVIRAIVDLITSAEKVDSADHRFDSVEPTRVHFSEATSSSNLGNYLEFSSQIVARSSSRYSIPTRFHATCPARGHSFCRKCPMSYQFQGRGAFTHDARDSVSLKLVQVAEDVRNQNLLKSVGIPPQCPDVRLVIDRAVDIEPVVLNLTLDEQSDQNENLDRQRREGYVLLDDRQILNTNVDYDMRSWVYSHPKSQELVLVIDDCQESESSLLQRQPDYAILAQAVDIFRPNKGDELAKLHDIVADLAKSVTKIYDRPDLHLAYRTVWHSVLSFDFMGSTHRRGWLECLVVGDTRCGKSQAFQRMAEWYGRGELVDCKLQTPAGVMGGVMQTSSGEYYVVPGVLPKNDGGIVCFDEFHAPRWHGQSIMDHLSSTRAEGVVKVSKVASATFPARVRSIWLANPGGGRLLADLGDSGVETIPKLIPQPEDVARFDFALAVAQQDVDEDVINSYQVSETARYPQLLARELLRWTYTRSHDQIFWQAGADQEVLNVAKRLCKIYDRNIPLVEPADQRHRVAKIAVSIAAQLASVSPDLFCIHVYPEHTLAAETLLKWWYDKPAMGYDVYSIKMAAVGQEFDDAKVIAILDETFKPHQKRMAMELLRLDNFTARGFASIVPVNGAFVNSAIHQLYLSDCIRLVGRGKMDAYEKTPQFIAFLKRYIGV